MIVLNEPPDVSSRLPSYLIIPSLPENQATVLPLLSTEVIIFKNRIFDIVEIGFIIKIIQKNISSWHAPGVVINFEGFFIYYYFTIFSFWFHQFQFSRIIADYPKISIFCFA